ncbi:unnamed protein product, partial [Citrullus colocynthis]
MDVREGGSEFVGRPRLRQWRLQLAVEADETASGRKGERRRCAAGWGAVVVIGSRGWQSV